MLLLNSRGWQVQTKSKSRTDSGLERAYCLVHRSCLSLCLNAWGVSELGGSLSGALAPNPSPEAFLLVQHLEGETLAYGFGGTQIWKPGF